ncbi:MAG: hypothetical protein GF309_06535 [Candidatus Lokiarchaeota archaeon]|nr:hypothetical protein [Candidatus Lokiarchaeota archaeon]
MADVSRPVFVGIFLVLGLIFPSYSQVAGLSTIPPRNASNTNRDRFGPYVDSVRYEVISQEDQAVRALQDGDIDLIGDQVDPSFVAELQDADNIEIAETLRNGNGYLTINCRKYPFNITAFRRALAYALDKQAISDNLWEGFAYPLDSCVPRNNPFSAEEHLAYHYYERNYETGNQLLDTAGFYDSDNDSIREAPNGEDFDVLIEVACSSDIAIETGEMVANALRNLSIDAVSGYGWNILNRLYYHGDYDIIFIEQSFTDFDVDWLGYEYWSEYSDQPFYNYPNFENLTYDSWRNQLLHSTDHEEVYEAAIEMQKVLAYQCPIIVCYQNIEFSAHRTDRFEGFKNDIVEGVPRYWTNYKVHLKDSEGGPFGGTLTRSIPLDVDTFNFMVSSSAYTYDVLDMMHDSLIKPHWNGQDIKWLADDYQIETHDDNPSVTEGHTRITFDLLSNITWSDGESLTAEDVAFTMFFYQESPGNPLGRDLRNMTGAFALSRNRVAIEFNTESYWHLHSVGYKPIIPQHVFSTMDSDKWMDWNPNPPNEAMVTSGPFNITEYEPNEYCTMTYNPNYFFNARCFGPSITHPEDVHCDVFHSPVSITWHLADIDPKEYRFIVDNTVQRIESWESQNQTVTFSIEVLLPGIHNVTIIAVDSMGNQCSDIVFIYVEGPVATLLIIAGVGILGICIVIVLRVAYQEIREISNSEVT